MRSSLRSSLRNDLVAITVMTGLIVAVYYCNPVAGLRVTGLDYNQLHARRMAFARTYLFGAEHTLPSWFPRQALGAPFWSNVQSFPFIPTRLLLLTLDPYGTFTYLTGVTLSAAVAALFTYLFARRVGMSAIASAAAGWTFGSCSYFSVRVLAGHLPLLEVYCGLPLLLWLVESLAQARALGRPTLRWNFGFCVAAASLLLGGHPQLPVYALAAATLYSVWRGSWPLLFVTLRNMAFGGGLAAFALLPMTLLIGRSTRVLALAPPNNDLAMPLRRLLNFFLPWDDGAVTLMPRGQTNPFHGYNGNNAYFYDTFVYCGWLPWIALAGLLIFRTARPARRQKRLESLLLWVGLIGLIFSTSITQTVSGIVPGTFLRSPARLIYFTEFALAVGLAIAVDQVLRRQVAWLTALLAAALLYHVWDLRSVTREFLIGGHVDNAEANQVIDRYLREAGDRRVAFDQGLPTSRNGVADDVGFFDSIILARPYAWLLAVSHADPRINTQALEGKQLPVRTLENAGVRFLLTFDTTIALPAVNQIGSVKVLQVTHPAARAQFYPWRSVQTVEASHLASRLSDSTFDPQSVLLLPPNVSIPHEGDSFADAEVHYERPAPDVIHCQVRNVQYGVLRLLETFDPGWRVTVDNHPASIVPAMEAMLAVPLPPGDHELRFEYFTPGAALGKWVSLATLFGLIGWAVVERSRSMRTAGNANTYQRRRTV